MILLTLLICAAFAQEPPPRQPLTVLLIPLDTKDDKATEDYKAIIPLTSPENGVPFDLNGDGMLEQVAWTVPDAPAAFLVIDKNGNGRIDDGLEIVGGGVVEGGRNAIDSLIRLRAQEGSGLSGSLQSGDALYEKLLLWRDANHNGVSESHELRPAREVVTRIGLGYTGFNRQDDHGNLFKWQGWMELRTAPGLNEPDGPLEHRSRTRRIYDVILRVR